MQETREQFVPIGAIAFFGAMIAFYAVVWLLVYGVLIQWR